MIEMRIYGKLRRYVNESKSDQGNVTKIQPQPEETLEQLLERLAIPIDEIYTIFLNSSLLAARSRMAYWIRHQQVAKDPLAWKLDVVVKAGDRVGLFGSDMSALVI